MTFASYGPIKAVLRQPSAHVLLRGDVYCSACDVLVRDVMLRSFGVGGKWPLV